MQPRHSDQNQPHATNVLSHSRKRRADHVENGASVRLRESNGLSLLRRFTDWRRKDLQPERFKQSHAHNVLVLAANSDVVEEDSFQLETEPAVQIDIAYVDVARVDVNLV